MFKSLAKKGKAVTVVKKSYRAIHDLSIFLHGKIL